MHRATILGFLWLLALASRGLAIALGDCTGHSPLPGGIVLETAEGSLRILVFRDDILRLDLLPPGTSEMDSTAMIIQSPAGGEPLVLLDDGETLSLPGIQPALRFSKYPLRMRAALPGGGELREPEEGGWLREGSTRELRLELEPGWHFGGTGERGVGPDLAGLSFGMRNTQVGGYGGPLSEMNINVPVLVSSAGFGLLVDSSWPGHIDLGSGGSGQLSWTLPGGDLSVFLFRADDLADLVEQHTWLSGRPPLPPRWSLGYLQSKYGYRTQQQALDLVSGFRERGLPLDGLVLDLYWFERMGDIDWNPAAFPDPAGMLGDLLSQGVHTLLITEPYVTEGSRLFTPLLTEHPEFLAHDQNLSPWRIPDWWSCGCDALLLDFSLPAAGNWWWQQHLPLFELPVAGLWTDLGEPERHPGGMLHAGGSADEVHNVYNLLWTGSLAEGFAAARPNQRFLSLSRSGTAGSQRYGTFTWSGDVSRSWGGLQAQIPILLNMGLSGFPWHGSDLGGFCCGPADGELYLRWLQTGSLSPVMRAHGVDDIPTEPWGFGPVVETAAALALRERQTRLPLLYSLAWQAHASGVPVARPLTFADPDWDPLWQVNDSWLLGEDLLVAPVLQPGATSRAVMLPMGEWIDIATGQHYSGRQTVVLPAPLDRLPQLVRAGGILPSQPAMDWADQFPLDTLGLDLWPRPGASRSFILHEDQGENLDYLSGIHCQTLLELEWHSLPGDLAEVDLWITPDGSWPGMPLQRIWRPVYHGFPDPPQTVLVDGQEAQEAAGPEELGSLAAGWWHDAQGERVLVQASGSCLAAHRVQLSGLPSETAVDRGAGPLAWRLAPPWPNPSNGQVVLSWRMPVPASVSLELYDIQGRLTTLITNEERAAGSHQLALDTARLPSGVYFLRLTGNGWHETRKLTVVR